MTTGGTIRPTRVEIDLERIVANAARMKNLGGAAELFAVVKADAYGHGAVPVARELVDVGRAVVDGLAVSLVEEGAELRDAGISGRILVMGPALRGGYQELVGRDLLPMVSDPGDLEALAEIGRQRGAPVEVHLKVDTGMGRLGFAAASMASVVEKLPQGVAITGIGTHLACADMDDAHDEQCMTRRQLDLFDEVLAGCRAQGLSNIVAHAANSAGVIAFPGSRRDWIRPGIALYGSANDRFLKQTMHFRTRIAHIRTLEPGQSVSYGALWRAERRSRVAVLPVGYADGIPRNLTGVAEVLITGRRVPLIGAISMDIVVADVTDLGHAAQVGEDVTLLGRQGNEQITVAEIAERAGLIAYEVTCGISKRVPRVYM